MQNKQRTMMSATEKPTKRIPELDYLKGCLILLVVSFHLVHFEQLHPYAKQVVYTFHMPGFLMISGYLMNVSKAPRDFLRTLLWIAVPYLFMASGYIYVASILPINDHIENLTPLVFLDRLLLHPIGPPWYLHAIVLCGATYYYIYNNVRRGMATRFILIGIAYYVFAHGLGILSFSSAMYFLAGAVLRQRGSDFVSFFRPGRLSILLFVVLVCLSDSPNQSSFEGAMIAYLALSSLLWLYSMTFSDSPLKGEETCEGTGEGPLPLRERRGGSSGRLSAGSLILFLGRNSLPIYVFSPIFTVLCKRLVPYVQFDPTGLVFLFASLLICIGGSLAIAWLMDLTRTGRLFFGRKVIN